MKPTKTRVNFSDSLVLCLIFYKTPLLWYRLKETSAGKHKISMSDQQQSTSVHGHQLPGEVIDPR